MLPSSSGLGHRPLTAKIAGSNPVGSTNFTNLAQLFADRSENSMPEQEHTFADWRARFEALQNEASGYGITSMVILNQDDPLSRKESVTFTHRGSMMRLLGMLDHTMRAVQKMTS